MLRIFWTLYSRSQRAHRNRKGVCWSMLTTRHSYIINICKQAAWVSFCVNVGFTLALLLLTYGESIAVGCLLYARDIYKSSDGRSSHQNISRSARSQADNNRELVLPVHDIVWDYIRHRYRIGYKGLYAIERIYHIHASKEARMTNWIIVSTEW